MRTKETDNNGKRGKEDKGERENEDEKAREDGSNIYLRID